MASTSLTRTPSSNGNQKTWTLSFWIKKCKNGGQPTILDAYYGNQSRYSSIYFTSSDTLDIFSGVYTTGSSTSYLYQYTTNRVFRDTNAWYHIVVSVDTTQATAGDRVKLYVNGVRETSFGTETQPTQNGDSFMNVTTSAMRMGVNGLDAVLSHVHYVDGTAYDASTFGSTDSTTGEWQINTSPSVTYGTNGFFIFKDNASVTDQSGNSNNLTVSAGTLSNTEDCPSNVFCTFNPLIRPVNIFYAKGNTRIEIQSGNADQAGFGTIGMEKGQGKYYMEFKMINGTNAGFGIADFKASGVIDRVQKGENRYVGEYANSYSYYPGELYYNGSSTSSGFATFDTSNIIGMAVDMDNMKLYYHKDGVYQNSGNPSAGTGGYSINDPQNCYLPAVSINQNAACANWGNGTFDGTAISSEGTNASGIGKFEYDVPTGFTALSTKGINL